MADTKIDWTDKAWNPITGCTPISEGCANCYAKRMANRLRGRCGYPEDEPFRVTLHEDKLEEPSTWKKSRRVFVCSMGDLFHKDVLFLDLLEVWKAIDAHPQHTFMLLTKRPQSAKEFFDILYRNHFRDPKNTGIHPPKNLWLGVTAENQARADERIPILLQIPAAVRFVSVEPMLGPVDLRRAFGTEGARQTYIEQLDWVICGGETGHGARPMHPDWARSLRDQCQAAGVPFFFKQWGEWAPWGDSSCKYLMDFNCDQADRKFKSTVISPCVFYRVGKKAAGRELDGQVWEQYPEAKP